MNQPLVSVVIPTFNRPEYLREALGSVVRQTYQNLEIIVQDNASDCDLKPVIAEFADPRIALFRNERNLGPAENYLIGYRRASGKYVAALGDDDRWHPEFVAVLVEQLERDDDLVLAFCDHDVIDGAGRFDARATERTTRRWRRHRLKEGVYRPFYDLALVQRSISQSATLFRRSVMDYGPGLANAGLGIDLYLFYLAARTGRGCFYTPRRLAQYRYQPQSITGEIAATRERRIETAENALFYWDRFLSDPGIPVHKGYFLMKRGYNALIRVMALMRQGRRTEALKLFGTYIRSGVITPSVFVYHIVYAVRLHRLGA